MTGKQRMAAVLAAALGMAAANTASADDNRGLYFGITGGGSTYDTDGSRQDRDEAVAFPLADALEAEGIDVLGIASSLDDSDIGWGVQVGYRFNRYIAAEVGYVDLGEALYEAILTIDDGVEIFPVEVSSRVVSSGPTAAILGMLPVGERFDVHAKAGMYFGDTRFRARVRDVEFDENVVHEEVHGGEGEVFLGVGGAWNISDNYSLRFEYQRFLDVGDDETAETDVDLISLSVLFR
jgi:OmpA-OmpF porin, OOP family